ncbi:hypothetical protein HK102_011089 [Quaeritorhiza haematococci]|nr:hypothetical protein HK102_011089 [Quaeritorhiza haematococci]
MIRHTHPILIQLVLIVSFAGWALAAAYGIRGLSGIAVLIPTIFGPGVSGEANFTQSSPPAPVIISVSVSGLPPGSAHGVHVHEFGDISDPTGMAAGAHFNPFHQPHGCIRTGPRRHAGDMGNIVADGNGVATGTFASELMSLYPGDPKSIRGRSLLVHEGRDDCVSEPAGNSG